MTDTASLLQTSVRELVDLVAPSGSALRIRSDEHRAYPRAFRQAQASPIHHERTPSFSRKVAEGSIISAYRKDGVIKRSTPTMKSSFSKAFCHSFGSSPMPDNGLQVCIHNPLTGYGFSLKICSITLSV